VGRWPHPFFLFFLKGLERWPHPFFLFFLKGWGDGHIHSHYSILEDGEMANSGLTMDPQRGRGDEMAHSMFTVLPQGDVAYSISFFLLTLFALLLLALN
jgi:hypothetical protein